MRVGLEKGSEAMKKVIIALLLALGLTTLVAQPAEACCNGNWSNGQMWPEATLYENAYLNNPDLGCVGLFPRCADKASLRWSIPWACSSGSSYNFYEGGTTTGANYTVDIADEMSSVTNNSANCNRIWLKSGSHWGKAANYLYSQCLPPGHSITHFGEPYNDNVKQVGLSYDYRCPLS